MTHNAIHLTRRHFAQLLAASAALPRNLFASTPTGFAHIASSANGGSIETFQLSGTHWRHTQTLPAANPSQLEPHPTLPILYAVHNVPLWYDLPRGAVSAYAIDPATGHLTHLHTQSLSLAATHPGHAAVSRDGTALAVASAATGIYNILPIAPDGALHPPAIIRKDIRLSSASHLHFLPDGKTIATTDAHQRCIHVFAIVEGSLMPIEGQSLVISSKPDGTTLLPPSVAARLESPTCLLFRPA